MFFSLFRLSKHLPRSIMIRTMRPAQKALHRHKRRIAISFLLLLFFYQHDIKRWLGELVVCHCNLNFFRFGFDISVALCIGMRPVYDIVAFWFPGIRFFCQIDYYLAWVSIRPRHVQTEQNEQTKRYAVCIHRKQETNTWMSRTFHEQLKNLQGIDIQWIKLKSYDRNNANAKMLNLIWLKLASGSFSISESL